MHKHRQRSKPITLGARLAASKNVRTRYKDGMKITMPRAPWEKKNAELTGGKDE